jgi:hypothetical protein
MADTTMPRRCGLCRRPLPAHRHELCARCAGNWPSARHRQDVDRDYNPLWDEDMQADVDAMKAALEGTEPDDA